MMLYPWLLLTLLQSIYAARERERWENNSHIRRQFKKLEKKLAEKTNEVDDLKERCDRMESQIAKQAEAFNQFFNQKIDETIQVKEQLNNLDSKIDKQEKDFVSSVLELYSRVPNTDPYADRIGNDDEDRGARDAVGYKRTNRFYEMPKTGKLFEENPVGTQIVVIGGMSRYDDGSGTNSNKFLRRSDVLSFDPKTNSTIMMQKLPQARSYHCSVYFEDSVYVIGGATVNDIELATGVILMEYGWEDIQSMNYRRKGLSCSVFRGRIWACGGDSGKTTREPHTKLSSCESYHPKDGWRMEASLSEARYYPASVTTSKGLYVIGGGTKSRADPTTVEIIPTDKDNFVAGPEPPTLRQTIGAAATVIVDTIFLMGGYVHSLRRYQKDVLALYPHENVWRRIGQLQHPRYGFQAVHLNSMLYVVGGNADYANEVFDIRRSVLYKSSGNNFTSTTLEISHPAGQIRPFVRRFHTMVLYKP